MKVMLLVMDEQRVILDRLYEVVQENCDDCIIYRLNKQQQMNLGRFLASVNHENFDRVVIFFRVKRLVRQLKVLKCVPGLIFLEHDAYQNYMNESKYKGVYSRLYRRLPSCRALVSGALLARRMQAEDIDAVFVSKGYDERMLRNTGKERDIPIGFLGSLKSTEYAQRKALLESLARRTGMLVARTNSGSEYLETLNRIKIFVSADLGMGEFMIKNFEAMACGCVLLAWSQGEEDELLGFRDMENVVFYRSEEEAVQKLELLQRDLELATRIAHNGQAFAESQYSFARVGQTLAAEIQREMRTWQSPSALVRWWVKLRYGMNVPG
ncbi:MULTISPECIES: glycosyltransferase [unclassified Pseudomonas]|uniref:glycosyltransferase family protein n=1 Tax=unclassified Pseudomonas TaxID=196821 RepID=UPI00119AF7DF|nr:MULTISPECIES: glycosyltransferase [unclassified Pseudomonas]TWC16565.1 glycosyl transferase family 1 [Pseudomonas sp. SJZ075]TWC24113.1 glycosyl transferase family 1 [Pseudomonas sp. SJZ074]TWC32615.1 glycosyl transferase family 1 [Pseudomonas sp. SJZ078]TWC41852.1 glycosyl transferase family 1 [Pseudomonas sp. SJZ085]TWC53549.1 glycosyl transferase family 1 [Pseudomonas sp. SJZ124]